MKRVDSNRQFSVKVDDSRDDPIRVTVKSKRGDKASHHMTAAEAKRLVRALKKAISRSVAQSG